MLCDIPSILVQPWWSWNPSSAGFGDYVYRWFNLIEATAWWVFGLLVLDRWRRLRRSPWEVTYALAFVVFGATDVLEAWEQSAKLLAIKGVFLAALVLLRWNIRRRLYPTSRLY